MERLMIQTIDSEIPGFESCLLSLKAGHLWQVFLPFQASVCLKNVDKVLPNRITVRNKRNNV